MYPATRQVHVGSRRTGVKEILTRVAAWEPESPGCLPTRCHRFRLADMVGRHLPRKAYRKLDRVVHMSRGRLSGRDAFRFSGPKEIASFEWGGRTSKSTMGTSGCPSGEMGRKAVRSFAEWQVCGQLCGRLAILD
jgi:hypothetical protein